MVVNDSIDLKNSGIWEFCIHDECSLINLLYNSMKMIEILPYGHIGRTLFLLNINISNNYHAFWKIRWSYIPVEEKNLAHIFMEIILYMVFHVTLATTNFLI